MPAPLLPPVYSLQAIAARADPLAVAIAAASAEDGSFFLAPRPDRLDCAILLHPEVPLPAALWVVHVAMVGLGDAIGALAPPVVAVQFGWPDRLLVNGALAGGLRLATAEPELPGALPAWQVLAVTIAVTAAPDGAEPGLRRDTTTLHDEGGVDIEPTALAESFSRHFLAWVHRWQEDGHAPVAETWLARAAGYRERIDWELPGLSLHGRLLGLDDEGGLLVEADDGHRAVSLAECLRQPSWAL